MKSETAPSSWRRFREPEVVLLSILVFVLYFTQLSTLDVRGEESRRGVVAQEMQKSGDYIVPRIHGDAFFMSSRPPLQMWSIIGSSFLTGEINPLAVRLPSVVAILLLVIVIYAYARTFLSRLGAFCAAAGYLSMLQVLELGRTGETDALFTLFVTCSLLAWHTGYLKKWNPVLVWSLGYSFAALATLTKGPQGPVYFLAPVMVYLFITGAWRYALRPAQLAGIACFGLIWGPWQTMFFLSEGVEGVRYIYFGDVTRYGKEGSLIRHLIEYPCKVFVCICPWSLMLLAMFKREFRENLGQARPHVLFLLCCLFVTFPSVWFVTDARTRFFMPLYPCVALLAGLVIERCCQASRDSKLRADWRRTLLCFAIPMPIVGAIILGMTLSGQAWPVAQQPMAFAIGFFLLTLIGSVIVWRARDDQRVSQQQAAMCSMALFVGLLVNGVRLNALISTDVPRQQQVSAVEALVPPEATLYRLDDYVHPLSFWYGGKIACLPEDSLDALPEEVTYFCFHTKNISRTDTLPFSWKPIGVVSSERTREKIWKAYFVIGMVTPETSDTPRKPNKERVHSLFSQFEFDESTTSQPVRLATEQSRPVR